MNALGPLHLFQAHSLYAITSATAGRQSFFRGEDRLQLLQDALFEVISADHWQVFAWALFANHYHLILRAPHAQADLSSMMQRLQARAEQQLNALDATPKRQIWHSYWDTCLPFAQTYHAYLKYVHLNPVRHGLVEQSSAYPFCSAAWFSAHSSPEFQHTVAAADTERLVFPEVALG